MRLSILGVCLMVCGNSSVGAMPPGEAPQVKAPQAKMRTDSLGDPLPPGALGRVGTVRLRHAGAGDVVLAFTPDGRTLVSVGPDGVCRRWSAADGKEIGHFSHPLLPVQQQQAYLANQWQVQNQWRMQLQIVQARFGRHGGNALPPKTLALSAAAKHTT